MSPENILSKRELGTDIELLSGLNPAVFSCCSYIPFPSTQIASEMVEGGFGSTRLLESSGNGGG